MAETECDMVVGETEMVGLKSVLSGSLMSSHNAVEQGQ